MTLENPIEFFFDFSSPYSYFLAGQLEDVANRHDRPMSWRPIIFWPILHELGLPPPMESGAKSVYLAHDMQRSARFYGVPYNHPTPFPASSHLAARIYFGLAEEEITIARVFAANVFRAVMVDGEMVGERSMLVRAGVDAGTSEQAVRDAMADPRRKNELAANVAEAQRRGVCGVPFVFVDDEPFFGADRLPQIEARLQDCGS